MVLGVFSSLAAIVKLNLTKPKIDNHVFRLHHKWTTFLCFVGCGLVAASDFIGKAIDCIGADSTVNAACWVLSTYTLNTTGKESTFYKSHGSNFHGLGNYNENEHTLKVHSYYQWVPFVLFIQGVLFYLPYFTWKSMEGKQVENLLQGMNIFSTVEADTTKIQNILKFMKVTKGTNYKYCLGFVICQSLNLFNVLMQMYLLDLFFGGVFYQFGAKVFLLPLENDENRWDPLVMTFPRITKCDFFKYGPGGTLERHDYFCILPQNLLNEKIFLIMWLWFHILACITIFELAYILLLTQLPSIRVKILESRGRMTSDYNVESLVQNLDLGDYFLFKAIARNVDIFAYKQLIHGLLEQMNLDPTAPEVSPPSFKKLNGELQYDATLQLKKQYRSEEDTTV